MKDVDGSAFGKALDMLCGKAHCLEMEIDEVRELANVADRFQMTALSRCWMRPLRDILTRACAGRC